MRSRQSIMYLISTLIVLFVPLSADSQHTVCPDSEWRQQSPDPDPVILHNMPPLRDVWGVSPTSIYAVGGNGWILHYDGTYWIKMEANVDGGDKSMLGVWASSDNDVWITGMEGTVLWFNGTEWHAVPGPDEYFKGAVHGGGGNVFILGSEKVYGADTSSYWLILDLDDDDNPDTSCRGYSIWTSEMGNYCVVGDCYNFAYDYGWGRIWGLDQTIIIYEYWFYDVWGVSENSIFALGETHWPGDPPMWHFDGSGWSELPNQPPDDLKRISGTSAGDIFGATNSGRLAFYDGAGWSVTDSTANLYRLGAIWGNSINDIYLVGSYQSGTKTEGRIVHFDGVDYEIWDGHNREIFCDLRGVWALAEDNAYAVGEDPGVYHYDGQKWTLNPTTHGNCSAIWANSPSEIFLVTDDGWVGIGNGEDWSWTQLTLNPLWDVAGNAGDDVYVVGGPASQLFHYDGYSWSGMHDLGATCRSVFCTDGVAFIGTDNGSVWRFGSFGYTEREEFPEVLTINTVGRSILTMWGASPDTLYIGGDAKHLVQFDGNTGQIMQLIEPVGYYIRRTTGIGGMSNTGVCIAVIDIANQSLLFRYDGVEMSFDRKLISGVNDMCFVDDCTGFAVGNDSLALIFDEPEDPVPVFFQQFAATAYDRGIELVWDVAYDAPIESFHLYRWESASPEEKTLRAELNPNVRSYKDDDVRPGVEYSYLLLAVDRDGHETWSREISAQVPVIELALLQNHPNPFNPYTTIRFRIPDRMHVELAIYDVSGRHIRTLMNAPCEPGETSLEWNGRDASGNPVGSGIYFYRLKAGSRKLSKKMILLR